MKPLFLLIITPPHGHCLFPYFLNVRGLNAGAVLNQPLDKIIRSYRDVLETAGISVERLILFGSRAKGQAKEWSDIDLCVVSPQFGRNSFEEMVKLKKLTAEIEPLIEPHPLHPNDLNNRYDPLVAEILAHGKIVG